MTEPALPLQIAQLLVYPIKGCHGISLPQAQMTPTGLQYDRQWMIVDEAGQFITQRQFPELTQIHAIWNDQDLILTDVQGRQDPITIALDYSGSERAVQVWRSHTTAIDQGDAIAQWLTQLLQHSVRLVRQSPQHIRPVNPVYAQADNVPVSFADGYPVLVTNTASLADLNARLAQTYGTHAQAVPMNRFRPNIVVASDAPFAEDHWPALQMGEVRLDLVKPCDRCIVITTDQEQGDRNPQQEPLKTLATFRKQPQQGILFGENAIPRTLGIITVGDPVEVVSA